jgi:hypothetical protein
MKKTYILDTNVPMSSSEGFFARVPGVTVVCA